MVVGNLSTLKGLQTLHAQLSTKIKGIKKEMDIYAGRLTGERGSFDIIEPKEGYRYLVKKFHGADTKSGSSSKSYGNIDKKHPNARILLKLQAERRTLERTLRRVETAVAVLTQPQEKTKQSRSSLSVSLPLKKKE